MLGIYAVKLLGLGEIENFITPPQLRSPLPYDGRGVRLPTPLRGGVLARGAG